MTRLCFNMASALWLCAASSSSSGGGKASVAVPALMLKSVHLRHFLPVGCQPTYTLFGAGLIYQAKSITSDLD